MTRFLNILIITAILCFNFYSTELFALEAILSFIQNFLKNTWAFLGFAKYNFWVFLSVPHLVDNYAKIVDGRGRNLMCHCTLPSRLVEMFSIEPASFVHQYLEINDLHIDIPGMKTKCSLLQLIFFRKIEKKDAFM